MIYFEMTDLIGKLNSKETYQFFITIQEWCNENLDDRVWEFDYSSTLCINGINIPCGMQFYTVRDAVKFTDFI